MNRSESIIELSKALSKFQGEVKNPKNTATNPFFKSKYAPLEEVLNTTRPILSKHGLSVIQSPSSEGEYVSITTILMHESGEWMEFQPLKLKTDKNTAQGAGSAITYARRYAISAILGIASEEDDDGNNAEPKRLSKSNVSNSKNLTNKGISEAQINRLYAIAGSKNINRDKVNAQVKTKLKKNVRDMTRVEYDRVVKGYEDMKGEQ